MAPKKDKVNRAPARVAEDAAAAAVEAVTVLNKKYGERTIVRVGDKARAPIPVIPTGIYSIDNGVIQAGGIPRGKITELYGPTGGGKTTLTLHTIAEAQALGMQAAFVDAEHALNPQYAASLGVDVDSLYVCQPDSGEQGLDVAESLVRSGAFGLVVVDSVAALVPQAELNGEYGDSHVGLQARMMSSACRKLTGAVGSTNTALVFINQIRNKIGVMYGNPETTTGGLALPFYASLRLDIRRIGTNDEGDVAVSNTVRIKGAKNRVGSPYRETEIPLEFGKGFNKYASLLVAGIDNGVIERAGAWYTFSGQRTQGSGGLVELMENDSSFYEAVYAAVLEKDTNA